MNIAVVREPWRLDPLAWVHRAEAGSIAAELRRLGHGVQIVTLGDHLLRDRAPRLPLVRVSDPVMLKATRKLTDSGLHYLGPNAEVIERCYDKYEAHLIATAKGVDCPATALGHEDGAIAFPLVLKPRRGSDSIGLRLLKQGPIPARFRTDRYIQQEYVRGIELTVAVFRGQVGQALRIVLPDDTPYSFLRKYLLRPIREALADANLEERVRRSAREIAGIFGVDWAARVDLIQEMSTDRLRFLECDVAPLVGAKSAFAASFAAGGVHRTEQLAMLLRMAAE